MAQRMQASYLLFTLRVLLLISLSSLLPSTIFASNQVAANETDLLALLSFKSLIWSDPSCALSSWNGSLHHCGWQGVRCGRRHPDRVTALILTSLQLSGQISRSLGNLSFLQRLNLSDNQLFGSIPHELGYLSRLRFVNLSMNSLDGDIPSTLGNCSNLETLSLRNNHLQGTIPSILAQCIDLNHISLRNNFLEGGIPPEFGFLHQLKTLSLASNNLTGTIPPTLGNITNLRTLYLDQNRFSGPIPASLGQLQSLEFLYLDQNRISGPIPTSLGQLQSLEYLYLLDNHISGNIPHSLYNLSSLIVLDLSINHLEGNLPSDMCDIYRNLQYLIIFENQLKGQIPASLSNCSALRAIDIPSNNFTGTIPSSMGTLQNLSFLQISDNQLVAKTPSDWRFVDALINCTYLRLLDVGNNQLQGTIPSSLANISSLNTLVLSVNPISGYIPPEFERLTNLIKLELEQTLLRGKIPVEIGNLWNLQMLDLSNNNLSGEIPSNFGNLTQISQLLLRNNAFEGCIPPSFGNMQFLELLDISHNKLTGEIPKEVMNIHALSIGLDLSHNYLNGSLPSEIGELNNAIEIYLSYNNLSGQLPSTIGGCQVLQILLLEGNLLHGPIPSSLSNLRGLQELDLSNNSFSGQVPLFIGGMKLAYLNISFNNFQGELPKEGVFKNVTAVDVRGNPKLCGGVLEIHLPKCISDSSVREHHSRNIIIIIFCIAGIFMCTSITMCFLAGCCWRRRSQRNPQTFMAMTSGYKKVSYNDLLRATNRFSSNNLIGSGTFGVVYKAVMSFGSVNTVAVKVLNLHQHGASRSFLSECEALRHARHRNLIKILSVCSSIDHQGNGFKALIFEFMSNGSLQAWLHPNSCTNRPLRSLTLLQRVNVAVDIAMALDYLHDHRPVPIVHCDLKPSNVLLDNNMTAHVGDFGLAKLLVRPDIVPSQSTSTGEIKGSIGYIPPEYGMGGEASTQGDVYSYGILLLEIFTGVSPTDKRIRDGLDLHKHVKMALPDHVMDIVDPKLLSTNHGEDNTYEPENFHDCLVSVMRCGLLCSNESPKERIPINDVAKELNVARANLLR